MKKILLFFGLFCIIQIGKSQTVLNEVYTDPGAGKSEFIELYNSSSSTQDVDCFSILTYWESGANKGWYVIDLPSSIIAAKGWYTIAAASPFNVQAQTGVSANNNWNSLPASGYLKKYQVSGATYTEVAAGTVTDLLADVSPAGASGHNYFTFLLQNGVVINGFWGGGPSGTLPSGITTMPALTLTPVGACVTPYTVTFSTLGAVEFVNQSPGSDNGYARSSDGKCGAWEKTAPGVSHTPNVSNGSAAGLSGSLTTSQLLVCNTGPGVSRVDYNITAVSAPASEADDFPVEVQLYYDFGVIGQLDGPDVYQSSLFDALISDPAKSFTINQVQPVILNFKTKRGCFDKVVALANGCLPLPVQFKSFTALRNRANVNLKWETLWEQNNTGFAVERNIAGNWEQIGFVASQAPGGNSSDLLNYAYNDVNNNKGITQYRIRQIDIDSRSRYSEIRSVRGESQGGQIIVYPNPSIDGKVNVSFEDAGTRDISVTDMSGRVIRQIKGHTNNNITFENLTPGMYSLRVIVPATGEQTIAKFVVSKR